MPMNRSASGFTMIEFMLVVSISGILIVGLAAIVEAPQMMLEKQMTNVTLSSADRLLNQLDEDVRFAVDVRAPSALRLELDQKDASTIVYEWDGNAGGAISRTSPGGKVILQNMVHGAGFKIETADLKVEPEEASKTELNKIASSWDGTFQLKSGYRESGSLFIIGTTEVNVQGWWGHVSANVPAGIVFRTSGLTGDVHATNLNVKLRRDQPGNFLVNIYPALGVTGSDSDLPVPDRTEPYASASVSSAGLPSSFAYHDFPLTSKRKLEDDSWYFIEMTGDAGGDAVANLCFRSVQTSGAAAEVDTSFWRSATKGSTFYSVAGDPDDCQCMFTLDVVETEVGEGGGGGNILTVPIAVHFKLQLNSSGKEGETLVVSVPVQNNVELVNQSSY